ncbi:hypothetical protein KAI04_04940 [Candidatus Pacearchaeota archaeon]|nr:hypothetical protein [Candidatus Pacearchaeota archaeon]
MKKLMLENSPEYREEEPKVKFTTEEEIINLKKRLKKCEIAFDGINKLFYEFIKVMNGIYKDKVEEENRKKENYSCNDEIKHVFEYYQNLLEGVFD